MDEYSDEILKEIQKQIEQWFDSFAESNLFKNMPESVQDEAWFIISAFSDHMYNYFLLKPQKWTASASEDVIADLFPRKMSADANMFIAVEPVLIAFFQYLNDMTYIKNAAALTKALKKSTPIMLKQSNDSTNWGPAKQFVMAAIENKVDTQDQDAMRKFMNSYNASLNTSPMIASPKVGRNEACPCGSGKKYKKCCGA